MNIKVNFYVGLRIFDFMKYREKDFKITYNGDFIDRQELFKLLTKESIFIEKELYPNGPKYQKQLFIEIIENEYVGIQVETDFNFIGINKIPEAPQETKILKDSFFKLFSIEIEPYIFLKSETNLN